LGHQTCKNRRPYNLYCVGADVKPCSIQSNLRLLPEKNNKIPEFYTICARKMPDYIIRQRGQGQAEAKTSRPRPKLRGRGQNFGLQATLASRT